MILIFLGPSVTAMLVIGVHNERPVLMLPWLVINFIGIILNSAKMFVELALAKDVNLAAAGTYLVTSIGLGCYFFNVVYSHYRELGVGHYYFGSRFSPEQIFLFSPENS